LPPAAPNGVTVSQDASLAADHTGTLDVTRTLVSAPDADADHEVLDKLKLPAACDTANSLVKPPAENTTTPDRATNPGFGGATTFTTCPDEPDPGDTDNQPGASLDQDA
jgi:hypothetical protein